MPNSSQVLTFWNGVMKADRSPVAWPSCDGRDGDHRVHGDYPIGFARYAELMACTGGNKSRDLFKNPDDRTVLDDYDFCPLVAACRGILGCGMKPYLKLGNVPAKFSADYDGGEFSMNIRPPTDDLVHYRYMRACAAALKAAFGRDEVRTWRFAVLTEADNTGWFQTKSKSKEDARAAFFRLYDYAARAFEEELGPNLVFGTHMLYPGDPYCPQTQFSVEDVVAHCVAGTNAATGKIGAPLRLLTASYYGRPDRDDLSQGRCTNIRRIRVALDKAGLKDVVTGVDEGRVIIATPGREKKDLFSRAVGASYQAAFDVRVMKEIFDDRMDYFATWGYFSGPRMDFEGVPSHHYFSSRELAAFEGLRRVPATVAGTLPPKEELDAIAGVSESGRRVRAVVGRFRDKLVFTNRFDTSVSFRLPADWAGKPVRVSVLTLDDRNNWFVDWERDRAERGITARDYCWSPDDFAVLAARNLQGEKFRSMFAKELQPRYAAKASSVRPVESDGTVTADATLTVPIAFVGNGAAYVTLKIRDDIFAPTVVGVPPTYAARDLCVTADGEIRHYGKAMVGGKVTRVYIASRDNGLTWTRRLAAPNDVGAMVKSPWSGDWIFFKGMDPVTLVRSKTGPGDVKPAVTEMPWKKLELRQLIPLKSRKRWLAAFSNVLCEGDARAATCYHATTAYSDDDGRTWTRTDLKPVANVAPLAVGDKRPHWFNNGCEPTVVELKDGTILLCARTSGPHAAFYRSTDGGATWSEGTPDPAFWQANTMPYFFRLRDGRLLFIWNNTAMLPTRDLAEYPELGEGERTGRWETVFTNRDALHAAISDDDGRTWKGFREVILNEIRNASDFRELGNLPSEEIDKSVHQTQAVELPDGKVLLALGQNVAARRLVIFDPDWLLETTRREDFRHGLGGLSNHLYVRSLSGGWRGWAGHCAWNRMPGATLVRDPYTDNPPAGEARSVREVLQLCRIRDPRLVSDRQGVVWNFPAARRGRVTLDCRIVGRGFRLTLADHWMNPCDETGPALSPFSQKIDMPALRAPGWHKLAVAWDCGTGKAEMSVDGKSVGVQPFAYAPRFGLSYLHLQTLAEDMDPEGTYFREFVKE